MYRLPFRAAGLQSFSSKCGGGLSVFYEAVWEEMAAGTLGGSQARLDDTAATNRAVNADETRKTKMCVKIIGKFEEINYGT